MPELIQFRDLEKVASHRFRGNNSVNALRIGTPVWLDFANGWIKVDPEFRLLGWSDKLEPGLMINRKGQIGLLLWHPDYGECWEHYPLCDEGDMDAAVFKVSQ